MFNEFQKKKKKKTIHKILQHVKQHNFAQLIKWLTVTRN